MSCSTIESIWKNLFDDGESKYKCFFEPIWNNTMYVRGCFVRPCGSNVKMIKEFSLVHDV
jgi:hypothetical protein